MASANALLSSLTARVYRYVPGSRPAAAGDAIGVTAAAEARMKELRGFTAAKRARHDQHSSGSLCYC